MGSCIRLRNSILTSCSFFSIRFLIVLRPITNEPHLRDRVQKCVKPRKSNGSGLPSPCSSTPRERGSRRPSRRSAMSRSAARARTGQDRTSLYQEITEKIIAELEAGRIPWVQPWGTAAAKAPLAMPQNAASSRRYSGINVLILWGAVIERGFAGQSWLTFRQALSLGGHVRKDERGTTVVYADRFVPDDEKKRAAEAGDEAHAIPFLKRFTVFNTDQCDD